MSKLAEEIYNCKSEILDMQCDSSRHLLIQYLLSGSPVLVPYPLFVAYLHHALFLLDTYIYSKTLS